MILVVAKRLVILASCLVACSVFGGFGQEQEQGEFNPDDLDSFNILTQDTIGEDGMGQLVDKASSEDSDVVFMTSYALGIRVYDNGRDVTPPNWNMGHVHQLLLPQERSHLIAIQLRMGSVPPMEDDPGPPPFGFIFSLDQLMLTPMKYSYTDATWRCTRQDAYVDSTSTGLMWYDAKFDDLSWKNAESLGRNGDYPYEPMEAIRGDAEWIWPGESSRTNLDERFEDIYCRGWLSEYPDTFLIGAKEGTEVAAYADGVQLGETSSPTHRAEKFVIPGAVDHVIAVHAKARKGTSPGFIGNLQLPKAPGGVTGDLWKCKTSLEAHEVGTWILSMFDDTSWKLADTIESENPEDEKEEVKPVLDISPFAQWIWAPTKSQLGGTVPLEVFCRSTSMSSNAMRHYHSKSQSIERRKEEFADLPIVVRDKEALEITSEEASEMTVPEFFREFVMGSKPVKIKGGIRHWPAMEKWSDQYLDRKIGHEDCHVTYAKNKDDVFYFYGEKSVLEVSTVTEFLQVYKKSNGSTKPYLAQHPLKRRGKSKKLNLPLAKDIEEPRFGEFMDLQAVNLWMGPGGQLTPAHFDGYENFLCMVSGRKKIRLYEPAMSNFMYPVMHNTATGITSRIPNISQIDTARFPRSTHLKPVFVELEPGDMFYLPAYWWHEITSVERNVAVNWWFTEHSDLAGSIYRAWTSALPQTKWGLSKESSQLKLLEEADKQQREEEGRSGSNRRKHKSRDEL